MNILNNLHNELIKHFKKIIFIFVILNIKAVIIFTEVSNAEVFQSTGSVLPLIDAEDISYNLNLSAAVGLGVETSTLLAELDRQAASSRQDVNLAVSRQLPQINISAQAHIIDKKTAIIGGLVGDPEQLFAGVVTLSQLIFAEPAWANINISKNFYSAQQFNLERAKLDIILNSAVSYFNLLKTMTSERVQKDNLILTRSNLELAQLREKKGVLSKADIYRWKSRISNETKLLLEIKAATKIAEIALNNIIGRPLDDEIFPEDVNLEYPVLITNFKEFFKYISDPEFIRIFGDFSVETGFSNSVEIKIINEVIEAQKKVLTSAQWSLWAPELAFNGSIKQLFGAGGAGSKNIFVDDTLWRLGLDLTFPLFAGGAKWFTEKQAKKDLEGLHFQRQSIYDDLEAQIRSALQDVAASYAGIGLSGKAYSDAEKNLELIRDNYAKGQAPVIDLLDAQNLAVAARQAAQNAVYDFLINLMRLERFVSRFDFNTTVEEKNEWLKKLEKFSEINK